MRAGKGPLIRLIVLLLAALLASSTSASRAATYAGRRPGPARAPQLRVVGNQMSGITPILAPRQSAPGQPPAVQRQSMLDRDHSPTVHPWMPAPRSTFQWQLGGTISLSPSAAVYDVDLFDTSAATVAALHRRGRHVICYVSVGSYETWRPDASRFPRSVIGRPYQGWPGERWLDIRNIAALAPIMRARLDACKARGFDAVEPDNIDAYQTDGGSGFPLTAQDQLRYNCLIAREAHKRGLSIGLKNDGDQVAALAPYFDWALTEDCYQQGWCGQEQPFLAAHKAVFAAEYTDVTAPRTFRQRDCPQAQRAGLSLIYKHRDLGSWRMICP